MAIERRSRRGLARGPFRERGRIEREIENVCGRFFRERPWLRLTGEASGLAPALAMLDRKGEIVLRADLPGLEQSDIEVTVDHGVLNIRGERKEERESREEAYSSRERWAGISARSLTLPADVDVDKVSTTFQDGVLEVHLPRTQEARGKMIEIKVE
ncbi:MAG: Hsp20/alpha crystallin family protein [Candidatus Methylomirabilales bacterium]